MRGLDPVFHENQGAGPTATAQERARLWEPPELWPPYADHQQKTEREIPVVVRDPVR